MNRREILKMGALATAGIATRNRLFAQDVKSDTFSVMQLTKGQNFHWFGYYDKLQTDPAGRFVLAMQNNIEGRTPTPDDVIKIGYIDTKKENRWTEVGESRSWGWQQGCMLQWLPGSEREIIWNDCVAGKFVAHIVDIGSGKKRTIPSPIYAISPDGKTAITTN